MALKKDKQKVLGEVFDDERVKSFLIAEARDGVNLDYMLLERAYRGMKADNFKTFVSFFIDAGHDINSTDPQGNTFLQTISNQRLSDQYYDALKAHGAK